MDSIIKKEWVYLLHLQKETKCNYHWSGFYFVLNNELQIVLIPKVLLFQSCLSSVDKPSVILQDRIIDWANLMTRKTC